MKDKLKTLRGPSKKAEHRAKIAALKQKALDAFNADIQFKGEQAGRMTQLERAMELLTKRVVVLEARPAGSKGDPGKNFWGQ